MVVCKYFQQGSCRYGQSCRFDHVYGSKYSYNASSGRAAPAAQAPGAITNEQLIDQVQTDMLSILKGKQWLLSAYAPFKEKPNFPGFTDLSPEEARLFIYEAKATNTIQQAASYFNSLWKEAKCKHEELLVLTPNLIEIFQCIYKGEKPPPRYGSQTSDSAFGSTSNAASSIFRNAAQSSSLFRSNNAAPSSVFGSNNTAPSSVFGTNNASQTSVFGSSNAFQKPETAKSIFAQATQNVFGNPQISSQNNVFGSPPASNPTNLFSNASQKIFGPQNTMNQPQAGVTNNVFQKQETQNQSVFSQNPAFNNTSPNLFTASQSNNSVFGQKPAQTSSNIFGHSTPSNDFGQSSSSNVFGQPTGSVGQQLSDKSTVYSQMEELTPDDIESFKSAEFKLGFIPELPPPKSLCT